MLRRKKELDKDRESGKWGKEFRDAVEIEQDRSPLQDYECLSCPMKVYK